MKRAYWATTDIGPYVRGQVLVFEEDDGWVRTGWFMEIYPPAEPITPELLARIDRALNHPETLVERERPRRRG